MTQLEQSLICLVGTLAVVCGILVYFTAENYAQINYLTDVATRHSTVLDYNANIQNLINKSLDYRIKKLEKK